MILLTEGQSLSRLFDLDWQLLADSVLMLVAIFFLFLVMSYFLFNPAREMLASRKDKIRGELESAKQDMEEASRLKGEYEEKLAAANLQLMMELPPDCTVMADGRLLWRVLDNLLNNCCKYAMPGTRVYLHVTTGQTRAAIFVKNVSREVLNIDPDTLMERFVRADASRSTEGSGLGLSIARSLTELQHGTFGLRIDGDLFKVELTLPICNGIAAENGEAAE